MSFVNCYSRLIRNYLMRPESLMLILFILLVLAYFHFVDALLRLFYRAKISAILLFGGDPRPVDSPTSSKHTSWDLRKGNIAVFAIRGRRHHMEDRFNLVHNFENTGISVYGIFDGHGGEFAADFASKMLFKSLIRRLLPQSGFCSQEDEGYHDDCTSPEEELNFAEILTEEILAVDEELLAAARTISDVAGTTALVAMVKDHRLVVANVGDSRGVICNRSGKATALSFDHKPQALTERKRIKQAGGFISFNGVWRVAGVLATSRALGDFPLKDRNLVIADPDILTFDLRELDPLFMILATDGLWDAFSNEEAAKYIKDRLDEPHFGAKSIVLQAYYKGSLDNITVMVVNFRDRLVESASLSSSATCQKETKDELETTSDSKNGFHHRHSTVSPQNCPEQ